MGGAVFFIETAINLEVSHMTAISVLNTILRFIVTDITNFVVSSPLVKVGSRFLWPAVSS